MIQLWSSVLHEQKLLHFRNPTNDKYCAVQKQSTVWESDYPKRYLWRNTHLTHKYSIILVHEEVPEFLCQFCDVAEVVIFHKLI
jgi:hypothetical protein